MGSFFKSFKWAGRGVWQVVKRERNFRLHLCAGFYVYLFSLFYALSAVQYVVLTVLICGVLALEILNSAVERLVDLICNEPNEKAGLVKDMAAGAVLVFCVGAAGCGVLLFWDVEVFGKIVRHFGAYPILLILLLVSLAFCGWFIFGWNREGKAR
ncbi:MAG: diacylglycerol kinase family protein [Oscillospiraceae bacterium]